MSRLLGSTAGVTLIEGVIAGAILFITLSFFILGTAKNANDRANQKRTVAYREVEESLGAMVANKLGTFLETMPSPRSNTCNAANYTTLWPVTSEGLTFTRLAPSTETAPLYAALGEAYTGNQDHEAAKTRCKTLQSDTSGLATKNNLYFCLKIIGNSIPQANSIFWIPPVFAEVSYFMIDGGIGAPVTCQTFDSFPSRAAKIIYTLYWRAKGPKGFQYYSHSGLLLAASR